MNEYMGRSSEIRLITDGTKEAFVINAESL
jgi:hypothetical protein